MKLRFSCRIFEDNKSELVMGVYLEGRKRTKLSDFIASCRWHIHKKWIFDFVSGKKMEKDFYRTELYTLRFKKKSKYLKLYNFAEDELFDKFKTSDFIKIVRLYLEERNKFEEDRTGYIKNMINSGAKIIIYDDFRDEINNNNFDRYKKEVESEDTGYVMVETKKGKKKLLRMIKTSL